ncbi:MAG: MFS transporter [Candidatus Abyssubacteria bacterium]
MTKTPFEHLQTEAVAKERAFDEFVRRNFRWNFTFNLLYGLFGTTGWRLIMAPTFVPTYIHQLGGSNFIVGLLFFFGGLTRFITPPVTASLVEHHVQLKKQSILVGSLMRIQVLMMAVAGFFFSAHLNLISFFIFFSLFNLFMGMQNVVYNTVMAKVIPVDRRGRFIGLREFVGGVTAFLVALVAGSLVERLTFPHGYAATYFLAFLLTSAGLAFFAFSREPATPAALDRKPPLERLRSLPTLMREDRNFANYCLCRVVGSLALMSRPFFILYVGKTISLSGTHLGWLTSFFLFSQTFINLFLGRVADQSGFRKVFMISVILWTVGMAALVLLPISFGMASVIFIALGAGMGGFMMSMQNMALEFGSTADLPMRIGLANSIGQSSLALGPLLAGFLADNVSYESLFWISIACTATALGIMYFSVSEPRNRNPA